MYVNNLRAKTPHYNKLAMLLLKLLFHLLLYRLVSCQNTNFTFNGFLSNHHQMILDGIAEFTPNGLLRIANTTQSEQGHAFYSNKIDFKTNSNGNSPSSISSFSTTFVFAMVPKYPKLSANGLAFVIAPTRGLPNALAQEYLGLFNMSNNGNAANHIFAVELDTIQDNEVGDRDSNHVAIDINGINSTFTHPAGYYSDAGVDEFVNLTLGSGKPMQVWVEYDALKKQTNVTLAPLRVDKPNRSLLTLSYDLSQIINQEMFVGFSSSSARLLESSHYILGWSFMVNGTAESLILSKLPKLPPRGPVEKSKLLTVGLPFILLFIVSSIVLAMIYYFKRKKKFAEVLEDWEQEYGPHRFKYKDLYVATKGFNDKELLGSGGFGRVYRGVLPCSKLEVAIKKLSHESRQGMKEFIAEIVSIGRLRHRNIVPFLGYCRRKNELLLVYDYMPKGSLDKVIHNNSNSTLNWSQRFRVIKGVAAGLCYLHHEWEQVVIHRDVKASNVLLDGELNGRLGDFGLARLYDHGTDPHTTHLVGTIGYLAPEHTRTGKATTKTDVYSFGAFLLEVACGKRPVQVDSSQEHTHLVDYVFSCWFRGEVVHAVDHRLGVGYDVEEVELVLKLGLLCCNAEPLARPSMQQVVQYLEGYVHFPEMSFAHQGYDDFKTSHSFSIDKTFSCESSVTESLLSGGR